MVDFKISKKQPDIYPLLKKKFGIDWKDGIIITYGDTIHCRYNLPPEKVIHENVYVKQQTEYGKDAWWSRYLSEPDFVKNQELEAYTAEANFLKKNIQDKNELFRYIHSMAKTFSSHMYGHCISFDEALRILYN